ncbi:MAG: DUF5915 domain-containing protein, partial [Chloroflexota bacterium]
DVDSALDGYNPTEAGRKMEDFVDVLSNWYVRRSRRRFWKSENDADKLSAYHTLYRCLVTLSKLLAPLMPFVSEEIYRNLVGGADPQAPESVHLADFPVADMSLVDRQLSDETRLAMRVSSLGRAARSQAGIRVRQPLSRLLVRASSDRQKKGLERLAFQVMEEVNVKALEVVDQLPAAEWPSSAEGELSVMLDTDVTDELKAEGMAREIVHRVQTMRRTAGFDITDHIVIYYQGDDYVRQVMGTESLAGYIRQETLSRELVEGVPEGADHKESYKLDGHAVTLGVKRLVA